MSEFNIAFITFAEFLLKYKSKFNDFSSQTFGRFKVDPYKTSFHILLKELEAEDIKYENLLSEIVKLYTAYYLSVDLTKVSPDVVQLLDCFLAPEFSIGAIKMKFKDKDVSSLKSIRLKFNINFNSSSDINNVSSNPQGMSSSQNRNDGIFGLQSLIENLSQSVNSISERLNNIELKQSTGQNNQTKKLTFNEIGVDEKLGLQIESLINKKQRFENHISIFETHLVKKTTPASLFHCYFPRPLLWDDHDYIDMHNQRNNKWQKEMLQEDSEYLKQKINNIKSEINSLSNNIDSTLAPRVIRDIEKAVEVHLTPFFDKATAKCLKLVAGKYSVRNYNSKGVETSSNDNMNGNGGNESDASTPYQNNKRSRNSYTPNQRNNNHNNKRNHQNNRNTYKTRQTNQAYNRSGYGHSRSAFSINNQSTPRVNFNFSSQSGYATSNGED